MSIGVAKLPENFVWGVSSSAFQSEGHTTGVLPGRE
jgi:beta-glucosidase/6-phospho-beta-glucosidase/beta-galactosidase